MTERAVPRVVVVGAGPVGCSVAILLAQRGVPTLVIDRWPGIYPQPRAVHLDDEVHRILGRMHVAEGFAKISRASLGLQLVDRQQRVLGQFARLPEASTHGYPQANMYDQPALEHLLRERMSALPQITFRPGVTAAGIDIEPDGTASVTLADLSTDATEVIEVDYVLGADGANSTVRASIGAQMELLGFEQRWLVIDAEIEAELGLWEGTHQLCDTDRAGTYMRIGDTRHRWEFQLLPTESVDDYASVGQLEPLLRPWIGSLTIGDIEIVRTAEYTFKAAVADRWRKGPVFLLGDAAHLTPPFIGQGLGAGLRDADNLSWKLAGVIHGAFDPDVLDTYETERRPHACSLVRLARLIGITMTGGGRTGTMVRRLVVPPVSRLLRLSSTAGQGATPALRASALVSTRRADKLAGRLCPNVHGDVLLDDLTGGRWALVTREPVAPSVADHLGELDAMAVATASGDGLDAWLWKARSTAALVRPDGTVMASGDPASLVADLSRQVVPRSSRGDGLAVREGSPRLPRAFQAPG
jgi:3-(3-hydroxy-phenyl)propionate hydroxylase